MTTPKVLLLILISLSGRVVAQPTTDDQACISKDERILNKLYRDITELLNNQQRTFQETILRAFASVRPRDCSEIYDSGITSDGVYTVYAGNSQRAVQVYCDMTTDGGGWTVFQRRQDGSVDFYRDWTDYEFGFGSPDGEFWLGENVYEHGNHYIHLLTSSTRQQLRIDLADFEGNSRYVKYDDFEVDSSRANYTLVSLGVYNGTAGDSLTIHLGYKFSTRDQDYDVWPNSCAVSFKGGWWYGKCHKANLNGLYLNGTHEFYADGVEWHAWRGYYYSLRFTEMKV